MRIILAIAALTAFHAAAAEPNSRWLDRSAEGFFWYQDPEPEQEPAEAPAQPVQLPTPSLPAATVAPLAPSGPAPLSAAWLRENMQRYLDLATDSADPEDVAAFLYLARYAMDKSAAFTEATQLVTLGNPDLDADVRRPTATFANSVVDESARSHREALLKKVAGSSGLFVFFDNSSLSLAQVKVISMLQSRFPFRYVPIAVEHLSPEFASLNARPNRGHAETMGVTHFPATVLISHSGAADIVSQSAASYSDLQDRLLLGALRLGIISDSEYALTRGFNSEASSPQVDLTNLKQQPDAPVPIAPSDIVRALKSGTTP